MNSLLAQQLSDLTVGPGCTRDLPYAASLRVAAGTILRADADQVCATTVVGIVGADDLATFESLVQQIADDADLEARIRLRGESFSVRFSRRPASSGSTRRFLSIKALLFGASKG